MTKLLISQGDRTMVTYSEDKKTRIDPETGKKIKYWEEESCYFICEKCNLTFYGKETNDHFVLSEAGEYQCCSNTTNKNHV